MVLWSVGADMDFEEREAVYGRDEYYWGTEPSRLAETVADHLPADPTGLRAVDVGAGEGRDAVFFAEAGYEVIAVDVSPAGLAKAERLADERGVDVETVQADANEYAPEAPVDLLCSSGAIQYVRPETRPRQFARWRRATARGGIHAVFAFVDHPDVPRAPDATDDEHPFERAELQGYYDDWETVHTEEIIFEDDSGGEPHRHAARIHVARKPGE